MRVYNCGHCGHLVFFDSVQCMHCGSKLAFLPDRLTLGALAPAPEAGAGLWRPQGPGAAHSLYRPCYNHTTWGACNFAVPASSPHLLCVSCRQTQRLPDLSAPLNRLRWIRIEAAKRQLFYTLARLGLQSTDEKTPPEEGPAYAFLADLVGAPTIVTGHHSGTITLNVAEADDDERARLRVALHEPYRTLIGHLRHESGHFYWDRLVRDTERLEPFRALFGDERQDYAAALQAHYAQPPRADWSTLHVSAYAATHPWEDWAETWAHYLHMVDLLETAAAYATGLCVPETGASTAPREHVADPFAAPAPGFDTMVRQWVPLTLLLNSLNRSLGQQDAYPFALSPGALRKLRFVHDTVVQATAD
jgi:hypothetical protein